MKRLLLAALIAAFSICGQAQHTLPTLDRNNVWTGQNTFADTNGTKHITSNATDLGTQVNALITTLGSQGGVIHIAKNMGGYTIAGGNEINADNSVNLTIVCDGGVTAGAQAAVKIAYTGTGTPISARSTTGFRFLGCQVVANNASMAGKIVDLGHAGANGDSALFEIAYNSFFGVGVNIPVMISTDKANSGSIHNNNFSGYAVAIQGLALGSTYSNQIVARENHFSSSTGTATTAHIQNPGQSWIVASNTFEQGAALGIPKVLDCNAANTGQGVKFDGNWIGDDNAVGAHTYINCSQPLEASGNYISGTASTTFFSVQASGYVQATANDFTTALFVFDVTAGNARLDVGATNIFNSAPVVNGTPLLGYFNGSIKLASTIFSGATSGTTTLQASAVAGATALTLPARTATVATTTAAPPVSQKCVEMDTNGNIVIAASNAACGSGGSMTWPIAAGIAVYGGASAWGTSLTAPTGTIVGTSDTQVLTNKDLTGAGNTFPTFNQNTTGSAAKWTTARNLAGNSVDGTINVAFANKFIVQGTADTGLSGAQFLGALATCVLKNTTTTGVLSCAAGSDIPTIAESQVTSLTTDLAAKVPTTTTVNGHALSANVTVTASDVGLGSVTNDAQTKAAVVPNTAPSAGQMLIGNAGGTAYAPISLSGPVSVNSAGLTAVGTLNQNTSGTAANLSGTPALPNGTTATTQAASDNSTKLATTAYIDGRSSHLVTAALNCPDTSASGTAQVCNTTPTFTPAANDCILYTTTTANTGASLTLNVNSLTAKPVAKWQGTTTLAANDVLANKQVLTCYDGTNWELATIGNAPAGGGSVNVNGGAVSSPNFNGTTPATQAGFQNITFQVSGSSVSAEVPTGLTGVANAIGSAGASQTIVATNGGVQTLTLSANLTVAFTQPGSGTALVRLKITQGASAWTVAWTSVKWPGGVAPVISTANGAVDWVSCLLDGTNTYCTASQNFQ